MQLPPGAGLAEEDALEAIFGADDPFAADPVPVEVAARRRRAGGDDAAASAARAAALRTEAGLPMLSPAIQPAEGGHAAVAAASTTPRPDPGSATSQAARAPGGGALLSAFVEPMFLGLWPWQRLNAVQSAVFESAFMAPRNLLVVAPTGTGKTVVAELAIVGAMQRRLSTLDPALAAQVQLLRPTATAPRAGMPDISSLLPGKVVYLAPMAALCHEKASDWRARFGPLGIRVEALAGDGFSPGDGPSGGGASTSLMAADVICSTPEKWDALSRRWRDNVGLTGGVSLVILDEVHHVGTSRGAALEAIVARMVSGSLEASLRSIPSTMACRWVPCYPANQLGRGCESASRRKQSLRATKSSRSTCQRLACDSWRWPQRCEMQQTLRGG